jgi:hypothetical protein
VEKHGLVILLIGARILELGSAALDLHAAPGFVLDVLDIGPTGTDNLSPEVEAWNRL